MQKLTETPAGWQVRPITEAEFKQFRLWLLHLTGINLSATKRALVNSRLSQRLQHWRLSSYGDYLALLRGGAQPQEQQLAIDLLTTNETYFFREPRQIRFVREQILPHYRQGRPLRIWSAACSSGQEAYSLAMVCADVLGLQASARWQILASDLSLRMLQHTRRAHYPLERIDNLPAEYLRRYCLKGIQNQAGTFLIRPELRQRVTLRQINLNQPLPDLGKFDLIFLRNVLIYFSANTQRAVVTRLLGALRSGGHLVLGQAESLNGVFDCLQTVMPSVYRRL